MLFTSPIFLYVFLPAFFLIFSLVSQRNKLTILSRVVIIVATYIFYGFENSSYLVPFALSTCLDLCWAHGLQRVEKPIFRKIILAASILQNLSIFFIFKYLEWFSTLFPHWRALGDLASIFSDSDHHIALPPGVSFYLFESLSFVIDVYRKQIVVSENPLDFLTFISMFPRFIAGPIVRYSDLIRSIRDYRGLFFSDGFFLFCIGFSVKVLFADSFAKFVDAPPLHFGFFQAWVVNLAYTCQLYLDFSGYSLMAIGLGLAMGFPFKDNFHEPYLSKSISEFWQKWHISLSSWLRDYLYIPLGGNRKGKIRTELNLLATMVLGGIWHGANTTFLIWGFYHGFLLIIDKRTPSRSIYKNRYVTFLLVSLGWVMFRAGNMDQAWGTYRAMFAFLPLAVSDKLDQIRFNPAFTVFSILGLVWIFWLEPKIRDRRGGRNWSEFRTSELSWPACLGVLGCFIFALFWVTSEKIIPFLYFKF